MTANARPAAAGHIPALDGIRGLAVLLVVAFHFFPSNAWSLPFGFGWMGVDLFFALSGFLITGILFDQRGSAGYYRRFVIRRALRILPLYYAVLLLATIGMRAAGGLNAEEFASNAPWYWTFLSNVRHSMVGWPQGLPILNHFWSLAIEEQFYLVWPWLVLWCPPRVLLRICLLGAIASLVLRLAHPTQPFAYIFTLCRLEPLLGGSALAVLLRTGGGQLPVWCARIGLVGVAILLLCAVFDHGLSFTGAWMSRIGFTGVALLACAAVIALFKHDRVSRTWQRIMVTPWLGHIGTLAYGIYVFHHLLYWVFMVWFARSHWAGTPDALWVQTLFMAPLATLTYAVAWCSYRFWERPFLRLKDRWG